MPDQDITPHKLDKQKDAPAAGSDKTSLPNVDRLDLLRQFPGTTQTARPDGGSPTKSDSDLQFLTMTDPFTKLSDTKPNQSDTKPNQSDTKPNQSDTKPKPSDSASKSPITAAEAPERTAEAPERTADASVKTADAPTSKAADTPATSRGVGVDSADASVKVADAPISKDTNTPATPRGVGIEAADNVPKGDGSDPAFVLPQKHPLDPNKPTVAVLDSFTRDRDNLVKFDPNGNGPSHGELTASAAEQNNFNAIRIQDNSTPREIFQGQVDYSKSLESIEKQIKTGDLPLGKGDLINISMGQPLIKGLPFSGDPTFTDTSEKLGIPVTADTLPQKRDEILGKLKDVAEDPSKLPGFAKASDLEKNVWQFRAQNALATNASIDRLQAKGIDVVQAAGNDGPDRFSIDFMKAKFQLSSVRPDGKPDSFSANHGLTTPVDGVFGVKFDRVNMMDPTPVADQKGQFRLDGTNIKFPAQQFNLSPDSDTNRKLDRDFLDNSFVDKTRKPGEPRLPLADRPTADRSILSPQTFGPPTTFQPLTHKEIVINHKTTNITKEVFGHITDKPQATDPRDVAGAAVGTSFSNIRFFAKIRDQQEEIKSGRRGR